MSERLMPFKAATIGKSSPAYKRRDTPFLFRASKMLPALNWKPPIVSHPTISSVVGLWSSPPEEAAWTNMRFGQVGPGMDACQLSQTANSWAKATSMGSCAGAKHFMTSPGFAAPPLAPYEETNPVLLMAGYWLPAG